MKVCFLVIVFVFLIFVGCVGLVKFDIVKVVNGSVIDIYSVLVLLELNDNCIVDNMLCEVILMYVVVGMGFVVFGVLIGNINFGDFDKENYKGIVIEIL